MGLDVVAFRKLEPVADWRLPGLMEGAKRRKRKMPRIRKTKAQVRAIRQAAVRRRWDRMSPEERRAAMAPAIAASPRNKPGRRLEP